MVNEIKTPLKIIFMGSSEFALPALEVLFTLYDVCAVYTKAPQPAGRGMNLRKTPLHIMADQKNIPVHTPPHLKDEEQINILKAYRPDMIIVAAYGIILPQVILDIPKYDAINIHGSILPAWRGAAPIHRAIMSGDPQIGVSIMKMSAGLDEGDVYDIYKIPNSADITTGTAHDLLAQKGAQRLCYVLEEIVNNRIIATPQSNDNISYAHKIQKKDCEINWDQSADVILRFIRGLNPFPSAFCIIEGKRVKIHAAILGDPKDIHNEYCFACKDGVIQATNIQIEGKKAKNI